MGKAEHQPGSAVTVYVAADVQHQGIFCNRPLILDRALAAGGLAEEVVPIPQPEAATEIRMVWVKPLDDLLRG